MTEFENLVIQKFEDMDKRFDGIDKRLDGMDKRFDGIDKRIDGIDSRLDGMDKRFDRVELRLEKCESEISALKVGQNEIRSDILRISTKIDKLLSLCYPTFTHCTAYIYSTD